MQHIFLTLAGCGKGGKMQWEWQIWLGGAHRCSVALIAPCLLRPNFFNGSFYLENWLLYSRLHKLCVAQPSSSRLHVYKPVTPPTFNSLGKPVCVELFVRKFCNYFTFGLKCFRPGHTGHFKPFMNRFVPQTFFLSFNFVEQFCDITAVTPYCSLIFFVV